jgi:hypothetical protein
MPSNPKGKSKKKDDDVEDDKKEDMEKETGDDEKKKKAPMKESENEDAALGEETVPEPVDTTGFTPEQKDVMNRMDAEQVRPAVVINVDPTVPPFSRSYKTNYRIFIGGDDSEQIRGEFMMKFQNWSTLFEFEREMLSMPIRVSQFYDYLPIDVEEEINPSNLTEKMVKRGSDGVPVHEFIRGTSFLKGDRFRQLHSTLLNRSRDKEKRNKLYWEDQVWMHPEEATLLRRTQRLYEGFRIQVVDYHAMFKDLNTLSMSLVPLPVNFTQRALSRLWKLKIFDGTILGAYARSNPHLMEWLVLTVRDQVRAATGLSYRSASVSYRSLLTAMHTRTNEYRKINDVPGKLSKSGADDFVFNALTIIAMNEFARFEWPIEAAAMHEHSFTVIVDIIVNKLVTPRQVWFDDDITRMHNYIAYHLLRNYSGPNRRRAQPFPEFDPSLEHTDKLLELFNSNYWGADFTREAGPFLLNFLDRGRTNTWILTGGFQEFRNQDRAFDGGLWYDMYGFRAMQEAHPRMAEFVSFISAMRSLIPTVSNSEAREFQALVESIGERTFQLNRMTRNLNLLGRQIQLTSLSYPKHPSAADAAREPLVLPYKLLSSMSALLLANWEEMDQKRLDSSLYKFSWEVHRTCEEFATYYHYFRDGLSPHNTSKRELIKMAHEKTTDRVGFIQVISEGLLKSINAESMFIPRAPTHGFYAQKLRIASRFVEKMRREMGMVDHFYLTPQNVVNSRSLPGQLLLYYGYSPSGRERRMNLHELQRVVDSNEFTSIVREMRLGTLPAVRFDIPINVFREEFTGSELPTTWPAPIEISESRHVLKPLKFFYVEEDTFRDQRHANWTALIDPSYMLDINTRPFDIGDNIISMLSQPTLSLTKEHMVFDDDKYIKFSLTFNG